MTVDQTSSNYLLHFTGKFEWLKSIISDGLWISYCLEDYSWLTKYEKELEGVFKGENQAQMDSLKLAIPMTCFCDTHHKLISWHTKIYGSYGIAFSKKWANNYGISPVLYTTGASDLRSSLETFHHLSKKISPENPNYRFRNLLHRILCFSKPYEGLFEKGEYKEIAHRFYDECEWRYVPPPSDHPIKNESEFLGVSKPIGKIELSPSSIEFIIVKTSEEKGEIVNSFQEISNDKVKLFSELS